MSSKYLKKARRKFPSKRNYVKGDFEEEEEGRSNCMAEIRNKIPKN